MKKVKFLLFVIIMIVTTSCTTPLFIESYDDPSYNVGSSSYNPYGYDLLYSSNWGYYYYDPYRTRFLFDDYIHFHYPNLMRNWNRQDHWSYQGYRINHSFTRVNPSRDYTQNRGVTTPNFRRQNLQRGTPPPRNNYRGPAIGQSGNRGNGSRHRGG